MPTYKMPSTAHAGRVTSPEMVIYRPDVHKFWVHSKNGHGSLLLSFLLKMYCKGVKAKRWDLFIGSAAVERCQKVKKTN